MESCDCNDYKRMHRRVCRTWPLETTCDVCKKPYVFKYPRLRHALNHAGGLMIGTSYATTAWAASSLGWPVVLGLAVGCGTFRAGRYLIQEPIWDPDDALNEFLKGVIWLPILSPIILPFAVYAVIARRIP